MVVIRHPTSVLRRQVGSSCQRPFWYHSLCVASPVTKIFAIALKSQPGSVTAVNASLSPRRSACRKPASSAAHTGVSRPLRVVDPSTVSIRWIRLLDSRMCLLPHEALAKWRTPVMEPWASRLTGGRRRENGTGTLSQLSRCSPCYHPPTTSFTSVVHYPRQSSIREGGV